MAIAALGEIGDARAAGRLRRALEDDRPEIRFQAVIAFPRVCPEREEALEAVVRATHDDDPLVCHIALRMAEELCAGGGDEEDTAEAAEPIALPPRLMDRARALLESRSPQVRAVAAIVLARGGDDAGRPILIDVAAGELRGVDREDEAAAIELCGALGLDAARAPLERRAFGGVLGFGRDPLFWHARVALARMGHQRAAAEILRELGARDRDRRTLAAAAAGRARLATARDALLAMRGDERRADPGTVETALAALEQQRS
jgi:HEAT repeat protein